MKPPKQVRSSYIYSSKTERKIVNLIRQLDVSAIIDAKNALSHLGSVAKRLTELDGDLARC
jgi:hypothetical protein